MATIIQEGCIQTCSHCRTTFSFLPSEVRTSKVDIPPGFEPGEEGYKKSIFVVSCPKCRVSVDVGKLLGNDGKRSAEERTRESQMREDHDL